MPYIIAVLALVVIGTGFALLQKQEVTPDIPTLSTESSIETEVVNSPTATNTVTTEPSNPSTEPAKTTTQTTATPPKTPSTPTTPNTPSTPSVPVADVHTYKNGTYRTQSSYRTPDGTYQMDVTLTIANDSVTSVAVGFDADGARDGYSKRFSSGYQSQVTGKNLEGLNLSRVGGASLTTRAFNNALSTIRSQAS